MGVGTARRFRSPPLGKRDDRASDGEIERALETVAATLNDRGPDEFETGRIQEIVSDALGREPKLQVDDGGGLHDETSARVGAIRRSPSGEWITERQNPAAEGAEARSRPTHRRAGWGS